MRVQEHIKLTAAAAFLALPWLKQDAWIPVASGVLIDVDHYLWHAATHRTLSLRAALRYYTQPDPPQLPQQRLLHHPLVLSLLLVIAAHTRSRTLWLMLAGMTFHVSLDVIHGTQMHALKQTLCAQAQETCPVCGEHCAALQLHTRHVTRNMFDKYNPDHYVMLCPQCHEKAHLTPTRDVTTLPPTRR